jgi:hypothetical protein
MFKILSVSLVSLFTAFSASVYAQADSLHQYGPYLKRTQEYFNFPAKDTVAKK